jgi:hypothetical protein
MGDFLLGAAVALAATIAGWALSLGTQVWRERREARVAALFVYFELGRLYAETLSLLKKFEPLTAEGPSRNAWDQHAAALSRIADDKTMESLAIVYSTTYASVKAASTDASAATGSHSAVDAITPWLGVLRGAESPVEDAARRVGAIAKLRNERVEQDLTGLASAYDDKAGS